MFTSRLSVLSIAGLLIFAASLSALTCAPDSNGGGNGKIIDRSLYTPCGAPLSAAKGTRINYTFTGHEEERALGMQDFGARFYEPQLCQFTGLDPIDHPSRPPYAYAFNNPLNLVDRDGRAPQDPKLQQTPSSNSCQVIGTCLVATNLTAEDKKYHDFPTINNLIKSFLRSSDFGKIAAFPWAKKISGKSFVSDETKKISPYTSIRGKFSKGQIRLDSRVTWKKGKPDSSNVPELFDVYIAVEKVVVPVEDAVGVIVTVSQDNGRIVHERFEGFLSKFTPYGRMVSSFTGTQYSPIAFEDTTLASGLNQLAGC